MEEDGRETGKVHDLFVLRGEATKYKPVTIILEFFCGCEKNPNTAA